jgi:hypothetical protein
MSNPSANMQKTGTKMNLKSQRAARRNDRRIAGVADDDDAIFARVTKKLGCRRFLITVWDTRPKAPRHIIDAQASIVKKQVFIDVNDLVTVAPENDEWEIVGLLDKKTVSELKKADRLTPVLLAQGDVSESQAQVMMTRGGADDDGGIEFDYGDDPEAEAAKSAAVTNAPDKLNKTKRGGPTNAELAAALDKDDDVNIDDI